MSILFEESIDEDYTEEELDDMLVLYGHEDVHFIHPSDAEAINVFTKMDDEQQSKFEVCKKDEYPTAYSTTLFWLLRNSKIEIEDEND